MSSGTPLWPTKEKAILKLRLPSFAGEANDSQHSRIRWASPRWFTLRCVDYPTVFLAQSSCIWAWIDLRNLRHWLLGCTILLIKKMAAQLQHLKLEQHEENIIHMKSGKGSRQPHVGNPSGSIMANSVERSNKRCDRCNRKGHLRSDCRARTALLIDKPGQGDSLSRGPYLMVSQCTITVHDSCPCVYVLGGRLRRRCWVQCSCYNWWDVFRSHQAWHSHLSCEELAWLPADSQSTELFDFAEVSPSLSLPTGIY